MHDVGVSSVGILYLFSFSVDLTLTSLPQIFLGSNVHAPQRTATLESLEASQSYRYLRSAFQVLLQPVVLSIGSAILVSMMFILRFLCLVLALVDRSCCSACMFTIPCFAPCYIDVFLVPTPIFHFFSGPGRRRVSPFRVSRDLLSIYQLQAFDTTHKKSRTEDLCPF